MGATFHHRIQEFGTMKIKPVHVVGILAIVVGMCAVSLLFLTSKEKAPVVTYKTTVPKSRVAETPEEQGEVLPAEQTERHQAGILSNLRILGYKDDTPRIQALKKAMETPAFLEYQKKQAAVLPGFNLGLWWDFLESQGLSSGRELQERNFREHFPTGDYADYEPMMRKRLAELFLEAVPLEPTDKQAIRNHTLDVMAEFRKDWRNKIWMRGYFNGYDGDVDWANNIRQNAASIVAAIAPETVDASVVFTKPTSSTAPGTTDITEASQTKIPEHDTMSAVEDIEHVIENEGELSEPIVEDVFQLPKLPPGVSIENTLREQFSPDRFNRAMDTLNRYGPQEGLRRLKESDPEVAARVERLIQRKQRED